MQNYSRNSILIVEGLTSLITKFVVIKIDQKLEKILGAYIPSALMMSAKTLA